jgi:hypothetical protein
MIISPNAIIHWNLIKGNNGDNAFGLRVLVLIPRIEQSLITKDCSIAVTRRITILDHTVLGEH